MKKVLSLLVAMLILVSIPASAATTKKTVTKKTVTKKTSAVKKTSAKKVKAPKNVAVVLTSTPEGVVVGQPITLTASAQNQGSTAAEYNWSIDGTKVTNSETYKITFNKIKGKYVSTLTFIPTGNFNVEYNIKMKAGKSIVTFVGNAKKTFTVGIAKVVKFVPVLEYMKLEKQPLATGDTTQKYTLVISKLSVTREYSTAPVVETLKENLKIVDIIAAPFAYKLMYGDITLDFNLSLEDFNKLLAQIPAPTTTPTAIQ